MRFTLSTSILFLALFFSCGNHRFADETAPQFEDHSVSASSPSAVAPASVPPPPPPPPPINDVVFHDISVTVEAETEPEPTGDRYAETTENAFVPTSRETTSTFAIDADGGAYANVRRYLEQDGQLPPPNAVRTEEMINYFDIDYPFDNPGHPIALNGEITACPWTEGNRLVRIGIQGRPVAEEDLPANFVFLIDVSGSMSGGDKLPLLKSGMHRFVDKMAKDDYISIVTYASRTEVHLNATSGKDKKNIRRVIDRLRSGGGTNGGAGIQLAYEQAEEFLIPGGNNRILLGTDGDFNLGLSDHDALLELIEKKRESGIFLTVLGVGRGNFNEATMEQIANKGNGTYEYLDKVSQLEKVFFQESGKFNTVAKDVKVQVEFNPDQVKAYRLIGYENRLLNNEDFRDDTKDAGEIGAGQNVTALYEVIPTSKGVTASGPAFTIDFRYKLPDEDRSIPISLEVTDSGQSFAASSDHQRFVASVAGFSLILRDSDYRGTVTYNDISGWLNDVRLEDEYEYIEELKGLVATARKLE